MEDKQIVELYFARDERAIRETEAKYGRLCFHIACNVLSDPSDAEECVSDTYLGAWNAIPPTRPNSLKAFLCKIARNLSLKRLESVERQKRSRDMTVSLTELEEVLPDACIAPEISDGEISVRISDFLRGEKADARNVFLRRYWFFDSIEEIAARYSFSQSKVKSMLYHTRKKLKEYLIKEGIEL
ncbi:MAG: RNA polymerase sigma factor [Clostridia bacterium]|nr:RNA polymerase sigma factor [Clostridia bacterium]